MILCQRNTCVLPGPCWKSISPQIFTYKTKLHLVHVDLPNILDLDEKNRIVKVEPSVSIGQLNDFLIGNMIKFIE